MSLNYRRMAFKPGLPEVLELHKADVMASTYVAVPGTIKSFDPGTWTVTVLPALTFTKRDGSVIKAPILIDVPVFVLQGGGAAMVFPVKDGDGCLLVFADSCIDAWFQGGAQEVPPVERSHDLADAFALVGFSQQSALLNTPLGLTEAGLGYQKDGITAKVALDTATGKITIQNQTESLATVLGNLVTALNTLNSAISTMTLANITTVGPSSPQTLAAANATAIAAVTAALNLLLYT